LLYVLNWYLISNKVDLIGKLSNKLKSKLEKFVLKEKGTFEDEEDEDIHSWIREYRRKRRR